MCEYTWSRSRYKLFISRWGIAIILEAGYRILPASENRKDFIKVVENLYASFDLMPYPCSQQLIAEEQILFCNGLKLVSGQILEALQDRCCLLHCAGLSSRPAIYRTKRIRRARSSGQARHLGFLCRQSMSGLTESSRHAGDMYLIFRRPMECRIL